MIAENDKVNMSACIMGSEMKLLLCIYQYKNLEYKLRLMMDVYTLCDDFWVWSTLGIHLHLIKPPD